MTSRRRPKQGRKPKRSKPRESSGDLAGPNDVAKNPQRNACLDALRGLAIVLMVIDHVAGHLYDIPIQGSYVRLATRLSMPLFCVLMGYFLKPEDGFRWRRLAQILLASVLVNLVFYAKYQRIEILGTLLFAYAVFLIAGRFFPLFVFAILLYPVDLLRPFFDFPPTIVVSFVAQGMVLRRLGIGAALISGTILSSGAIWIYQLEPHMVNYKLCLFLLPSTLLVYLGESMPSRGVPGLSWIGRYPLSAYVGQCYAIFLLAYWLNR